MSWLLTMGSNFCEIENRNTLVDWLLHSAWSDVGIGGVSFKLFTCMLNDKLLICQYCDLWVEFWWFFFLKKVQQYVIYMVYTTKSDILNDTLVTNLKYVRISLCTEANLFFSIWLKFFLRWWQILIKFSICIAQIECPINLLSRYCLVWKMINLCDV